MAEHTVKKIICQAKHEIYERDGLDNKELQVAAGWEVWSKMINRIRFGNGVEVSGANKLLQKQRLSFYAKGYRNIRKVQKRREK